MSVIFNFDTHLKEKSQNNEETIDSAYSIKRESRARRRERGMRAAHAAHVRDTVCVE